MLFIVSTTDNPTTGDVIYIGMKEDVPDEDTKMIRQADIPVKNVGDPMT